MSASLRVLFAHNAYQQRGGEDSVVDAEVELLRSRGHAVQVYSRHNDELKSYSRLAAAMDTVWSRRTAGDMAGAIASFKPDIVHAHNTFPLISPSLYWAAARAGVPLVQTLHNFRLLCPQAMFLRDGRICEECLGRLPWRGVVHRCYRRSTAQSAVLAGMLGVHRAIGSYRDKVTRYIALNEFCRRKFIAGGIPAERIAIKPNFVDIPTEYHAQRADGLFVGRLSAEKGLEVLKAALSRIDRISIDVVGVGPEEERIRGCSWFRMHGWMEADAVHEMMRQAAYLVVPSIWYETFGLVALEAFACGTPVIASRLGALEELVCEGQTGLLFDPGSADDLGGKIAWAEANPDAMRKMGDMARAEYVRKYSPEANYQQLRAIYEHAVSEMRDHHVSSARD